MSDKRKYTANKGRKCHFCNGTGIIRKINLLASPPVSERTCRYCNGHGRIWKDGRHLSEAKDNSREIMDELARVLDYRHNFNTFSTQAVYELGDKVSADLKDSSGREYILTLTVGRTT